MVFTSLRRSRISDRNSPMSSRISRRTSRRSPSISLVSWRLPWLRDCIRTAVARMPTTASWRMVSACCSISAPVGCKRGGAKKPDRVLSRLPCLVVVVSIRLFLLGCQIARLLLGERAVGLGHGLHVGFEVGEVDEFLAVECDRFESAFFDCQIDRLLYNASALRGLDHGEQVRVLHGDSSRLLLYNREERESILRAASEG